MDFPVYRAIDIACSLVIACLVALVLTTLGQLIRWLVIVPAPLDTLLVGITAAGFIFTLTTWMPFLEHLSLLAPGELTPRTRRAVTALARTIPYLYGLGTAVVALVLSAMLLCIIVIGLFGLSALLPGPDISDISPWLAVIIGAAAIISYALFLARLLIMTARADQDWGLPTWRTFAAPGKARSASTRIFDTLDATVGHFVLTLTVPTDEIREAMKGSKDGVRSISAYRRFDGDPIDFFVSLVVAGAVLALVGSGGSALIGWLRPDLQSILAPPAPTGTPTLSSADVVSMLLTLAILVPSLFGGLHLLKLLAQRSEDLTWARQWWVRWLARVIEGLRIISCALFALAIGGVVAGTLGSVAQLPALGIIVIFACTALFIAWALLAVPLGQDSLIGTFLSNMTLAYPQEMASVGTSDDNKHS
ncbi:MAG: hypothetical protein HGA65_17610 [Oscillochloris sp.]|nr:hypothetical protein [Oscillochloris sp.]